MAGDIFGKRISFIQGLGWIIPLLALACTLGLSGCDKGDSPGTQKATAIKIGFIVKKPEEPWFQNEWKFAQQAADKDGFTLVKIGAISGDAVRTAINNLAAQDVQGFIICTPDVKLGQSIVDQARQYNLKVMSVDDQFVDADGKFMEVPHMGISATEIGHIVGKTLYAEMTKRGWKAEDTAVCIPTNDELETARQRTDGATEALIAAGFPKDKFYKSADKGTDIPGGFNAANIVLTQHPEVKHWLIAGLNDEAVLGSVRATEGRGIAADDVIGVGIGGSTGVNDFKKDKPTGFFATVLISPKRHGFETADNMYHWIKDNKEPPKAVYTSGILIDRSNYEVIMKEQGLLD